MNDIATIGRCIACNRPSRLHNGICEACVTRRGPRWAELARWCRRDVEFALALYESLASDRGRSLFLEIYGESLVRGASSTGRVPLYARTWTCSSEGAIPPPPMRGDELR